MKKVIISAIISFILGLIGGGLYVDNQNSTEINNLKAEIIELKNTNTGLSLEVQGGQGDTTGLSITTECDGEGPCIGYSSVVGN